MIFLIDFFCLSLPSMFVDLTASSDEEDSPTNPPSASNTTIVTNSNHSSHQSRPPAPAHAHTITQSNPSAPLQNNTSIVRTQPPQPPTQSRQILVIPAAAAAAANQEPPTRHGTSLASLVTAMAGAKTNNSSPSNSSATAAAAAALNAQLIDSIASPNSRLVIIPPRMTSPSSVTLQNTVATPTGMQLSIYWLSGKTPLRYDGKASCLSKQSVTLLHCYWRPAKTMNVLIIRFKT